MAGLYRTGGIRAQYQLQVLTFFIDLRRCRAYVSAPFGKFEPVDHGYVTESG
jgi:hypothetical protein